MKESVRDYILKNREKFGFKRIRSLNVTYLAKGEYNENYLVRINNEKFVFRINLYQQSGLKKQIRYEFKTLKFLEDFGIAPKPVFYDESQTCFGHDISVYRYVQGQHLEGKVDHIKALAESFNVLHSIKVPKNMGFMRREFIDGDKRFIIEKFRYCKRISDDKESVEFFEKAMKMFFSVKYKINPRWTIVHTDPVPSNLLFHPNLRKIMFIDWEKARVDDPSYDLSFVLSPAMAWDWGWPLNSKLKNCFIKRYKGFEHDPDLMEKVRIRYPFTVMWLALWTLIRISEIKKGIIDKTKVSDMNRYYEYLDILFTELKQLDNQSGLQQPF